MKKIGNAFALLGFDFVDCGRNCLTKLVKNNTGKCPDKDYMKIITLIAVAMILITSCMFSPIKRKSITVEKKGVTIKATMYYNDKYPYRDIDLEQIANSEADEFIKNNIYYAEKIINYYIKENRGYNISYTDRSDYGFVKVTGYDDIMHASVTIHNERYKDTTKAKEVFDKFCKKYYKEIQE